MKKTFLFFSILIIAGFSAVFTLLPKVHSQNINTVKVYNSPIKTIIPEHNFIGLNWSHGCTYNRYLFANQKNLDALGRAIRETNIDLIRYPGGISANYFHWDVSNKDVLYALSKYREHGFNFITSSSPLDKLDFQRFMNFCKRNGLKADVQVNVQNIFDKKNKKILLLKKYEMDIKNKRIKNTGKVDWKLVEQAAKSAARQVRWVQNQGYSDIVKYWEIGNEDYCKEPFISGYTAEEYARVASIFIKKMKAVDPSIKFILTNMVDYYIKDHNKWSEKVLNSSYLADHNDSIYAVSNHIYGWGKTYSDKSYETFYEKNIKSKSNDMTRRLNLHESIINSTKMKNTTIFVNEFNQAYLTNPYIHSWLGAIGNSEMVLSCVNNPYCGHIGYHEMMLSWCNDDAYQNGGFGLYHLAKHSPVPIIRYMQSYAIELLNDVIKGKALKTDFVKQGIFASAVKNNDEVKVILLNKGQDRKINLELKNFVGFEYYKNRSLGIDVPEKLTAIDTGDSCHNPDEIRVLNILNNKIEIKEGNQGYNILAPANTISVFYFRKGAA